MEIIKVHAEDIHKLQALTTRPNIAYSVVEYNDDIEEEEAVRQLVAQKLEEYTALAKIVVYSSSIESTKALRVVLECHAYYKDVRNKQEKEEIAQQFH
jgi:superfamily II DNA helicase RecQ